MAANIRFFSIIHLFSEFFQHCRLNLFDFRWQPLKQIDGFAFGDKKVVLDADADALIADVDAWLAAEYHPWFKWLELVDAVVHV